MTRTTQGQSVAGRIVGLLKQRNGEFRAEDGDANRQIAAEVGASYAQAISELRRLVGEGIVAKEGTPRRTYAYKLVGTLDDLEPPVSEVTVRPLTSAEIEKLGLTHWKE